MSEVQMIHILFVGPLLIYVGLQQPKYDAVYILLLLLGIYVLFKFLYTSFSEKVGEQHVWYAVHMVLFAMLLLYVGYYRTKTPRVAFSLLLAVGIAAFGYHTIRWLTPR